MLNETDAKLQHYKDSLRIEAEQLVVQDFPKRILKLNELLKTPMFNARNFTKMDEDLSFPLPDDETAAVVAGMNCMCLHSGTVPCNSALCDMIQVIKPIINQMLVDSNLLKMWVIFMTPKIQGGNNFGVSIQEQILVKIKFAESQATTFFEQITLYFVTRAKLLSKVFKLPQVDDYKRAVVELDEKKTLALWLAVCKIRNHYSLLHHIIIKNMEMIQTPRSSHSENGY